MDRCEVEKLFTLFSQFWPNKQVTAKMKLAWEIALEPYSYADVRAAAVAYARRNKFFPDVADITMGIAPQVKQRVMDLASTKALPGNVSRGSEKEAAWMRRYINTDHDGLGRISRYAREHNVTWDEAKAVLDG